MRKAGYLLAAVAAPLLAAGAAGAQSRAAQEENSARSPDVTVQGPERMVCQTVRRTGTRMRAGRVCRTVREWEEARAGRSQDEVLAEAADTLEMFGEKISTNCIGGLSRADDTSLGPR